MYVVLFIIMGFWELFVVLTFSPKQSWCFCSVDIQSQLE